MEGVRYLILTKLHHVEKLVNFLNACTDIDYVISTDRHEVYGLDFDVGVSYCFPYIIDLHHPNTESKSFFNYHPAPLPEYKGSLVYADAIRNRVTSWSVSLHRMTDVVDTGELVAKRDFSLSSVPINTNELGCIAHYWLFQLFKDTVVGLGVD